MPLGLGITKGASFVNDWEKDIDRTYQRAEYAARIQQEKERKTAYYAELLKKGHATNPRAEGELNEFYKGLNGELATFVTENPNFETDIDAMQKFNDIKDKYLNNDILRKDIQVGEQFERLRQAINSKQLLPEEAEAETKRYDDYINKRSDEPYVFTNFQQVDVDEIAMKTARAIGEEELAGTNMLDKRTGEWSIAVGANPNKIIIAAESTYNDPKSRMAINKRFEDVMKNPKNAELYKGEDAAKQWWTDYLKSFTDIKRANKGRDVAIQKALSEGNDVTTEYALDGKVKRLMAMSQAKDANGNFIDDIRDQSVDYDTNLTGWGSEAIQIITNNMGAKALVDGQYKNFAFSKGITAKQLSTGDWVSISGVPHLAINVAVDNPQADAEFAQRQSTLSTYGFQQQETIIGGEFPSFGGAAKEVNGLKHTGTVYLPLTPSPEGLSNWAGKHGGQKEKDYASPIYNKKERELRDLSFSNKYNLKVEGDAPEEDVPSNWPYQPDRYKIVTDYRKGKATYGKKGIVDIAKPDSFLLLAE